MTAAMPVGTMLPCYGDRLLDYAQAIAPELPSVQFNLPSLRLTVASDSPGYFEACRRALIDNPAYASGTQFDLRVTLVDRQTRSDIPDQHVPKGDEPALDPADVFGPGREGLFDVKYRSWQVFDAARRSGVEVLADPTAYPPWVASFPLRNYAYWAYQAMGWRIVHAATLGLDGKATLVVGAGGAGKSGTTLSGIAHGLSSVGDDYVAIDLDREVPRAWPVMKLMKQDARGLGRLGIKPESVTDEGPNWQNKYEFDFEQISRGKRAESLDLHAVLMPKVAHAKRSTITRIPSRAAMLALAPSNLLQLPGGWKEGMSFIAELIRRLPCYSIELSEDPAEIADAIGSFLRKAGQ
jgi:hypothetical protein